MATVKNTTPQGRENFQRGMNELKRMQAEVGWFAGSNYPDGTPVAYIATIQEFGYPQGGIPSRSFQRVTLADQQQAYSNLMAKGARGVLGGKISSRQMLDALGLQVAGDMRKQIASGDYEALADATLAARARRRGVDVADVNSDPLRDTNLMVNTLVNQTTEKTQ